MDDKTDTSAVSEGAAAERLHQRTEAQLLRGEISAHYGKAPEAMRPFLGRLAKFLGTIADSAAPKT
jgi:hypothetical protein